MITRKDPDPTCTNAPKMMIEEIAFVTAISGVCNECATPQITWNPMNTDSTNTIKCCMKLAGATSPIASRIMPPTASIPTWLRVCNLNAAVSSARFSSAVRTFGGSFFGCAAIAAIFGSGGGNVTAPACVIVAPRITSSSILCTGLPSLSGVRSVIMWRMLVA